MKLEQCCFEVEVLFSHLYFVKHEELEVSYFVLEIFLCVIFFFIRDICHISTFRPWTGLHSDGLDQ